MQALIPTEFYGKVTWLGCVQDNEVRISSDPLQSFHAGFAGYSGEAHSGLTRQSCIRVAEQYEENTEIHNTRQFSILSAEELDLIAAEIGLDAFDPGWVGASIIIKGIPDFTLIPPCSRLQFNKGTTLTVDMENHPCLWPGKEIEKEHPGKGKLFKPAANRRRGVTAWVEREGDINIGDSVRLHIPSQPAWPHLPSANK